MQEESFEVQYTQEGERLDKVLSEIYPDFSRSFFQKLIKDKQNGYLVDVDDFRGMSDYVIDLLNNKEEYNRIKHRAKKSAIKYSFENVKSELEGIYFGK